MKNAVYFFQISLSPISFQRSIFEFLKYANKLSDDVIHSTRLSSNMMKRDLLHIICGYQCDEAMTKNGTREVI